MKHILLPITIAVALLGARCTSQPAENNRSEQTSTVHLLHDIPAVNADSSVNVIVEIAAGSDEKWEVDKKTGQLVSDYADGKPRLIKYLPYPCNYGMIPQTLLPKDLGGDGDPLDVIVLGAAIERGTVARCRIVGVLQLLDRGEQDDKLLAVSEGSAFAAVHSLNTLDSLYPGVCSILETWFTNYKGRGKMVSQGFAGAGAAEDILVQSMAAYDARR